MNTFGDRTPLCPAKAEGCTVTDIEGKKYTDLFGGIAVCALGYGYPSFARALHAQVDKLLHTSNVFYNEPQALLAQMLIENSFADQVFFANSGGEANEGALKLVRKYWKTKNQPEKYGVISLCSSFHGRTLCTTAATGQEKYQKPYTPLPAGFSQVPGEDLAALEAAITPNTGAVLLETIQCEGGVRVFSKAYIQDVRKLCNRKNLLLIVDEVQTGMGRTGTLFSYEQYGITPDIMTLAKALGGGVPIGAFLATEEVASAFQPGDHGTTFGGNPLACAAGVAVMHAMLDEGLLAQVAPKGELLMQALASLQTQHPATITDIRGKGLMIGIDLQGVASKQMMEKFLDAGFIVGTAGANTLRLAPPFVLREEEINSFIDAFRCILSTMV